MQPRISNKKVASSNCRLAPRLANCLASLLHADAVVPDGTIEAVSMPGAKGFLLGLQWHPEWRWRENEVSRAIFAAFGAALRERAEP